MSVKWASWNVGAESPEEFGDYFAWGEVETKDYYAWENYKFYDVETDKITKYSIFGVDNKSFLDSEDDAAHHWWGGEWRMPTKAELFELLSLCTWSTYTIDNIKYMKGVGPNGNSIVFPYAGYKYGQQKSMSGNC